MQVLKDKYGESSPSGIKAVLAPGNHPKTSDRINKNLKWMKQYSGGHVDVKDGWIVVNGERLSSPLPQAAIPIRRGPSSRPANWTDSTIQAMYRMR